MNKIVFPPSRNLSIDAVLPLIYETRYCAELWISSRVAIMKSLKLEQMKLSSQVLVNIELASRRHQ